MTDSEKILKDWGSRFQELIRDLLDRITDRIRNFWDGLSNYQKILTIIVLIWPFILMISLGEFSFRNFLSGLIHDSLIILAYYLGKMEEEKKNRIE